MKIANKSFIAVALFGMSALACADTSGVYLDGGLGMAMQQSDNLAVDIDPGFGGKIAIGYRFRKVLATEIGYAWGGGTWRGGAGEEMGLNTGTIFGAIVGIVPLGETWELFGRIGYGRSRTELLIDDMHFISRSDNALVYGFGIGYRQPESIVTVRLEYNHLSSDQSLETDAQNIVGPSALNLVNLGIVLNF